MSIKRAATTVLFSAVKNHWQAMDNAVGVSLFLFSDTQLSVHLLELFNAFFKAFPDLAFIQDYYWLLNNRFSLYILILFRIAVCFIFLFAKKSFIEQGSLTLVHRPKAAIKTGVGAYLIFISLGAVFFISAVGIPAVFVLFAGACFFMLIGEASTALAIGNTISRKAIKRNFHIETDMLMGVVAIECIKLIPVSGTILYVIIIPIVSLGVVITAVIDGYIKKIIYYSNYQDKSCISDFSYDTYRNIILGAEKGEEQQNE